MNQTGHGEDHFWMGIRELIGYINQNDCLKEHDAQKNRGIFV